MLAAEAALALFRIEHVRVRGLLATLERALTSSEREPLSHIPPLIALVDQLQAMDEVTRRPKARFVLERVRARSPDAERLVHELELERERLSRIVDESRAVLQQLMAEGTGLTREATAVLEAHRQLIREHLDREETLLHSRLAQLLSEDDWAELVSSLSLQARTPAPPRFGKTGRPGPK